MTAEVAIAMMFAGTAFIFAYLGGNLDDEHIVIKLFFKMVSLFLLMIGLVSVGKTIVESEISSTYYVAYWFMGVIIFLVFVYWAVYLLVKMLQGMKVKKNFEEGVYE